MQYIYKNKIKTKTQLKKIFKKSIPKVWDESVCQQLEIEKLNITPIPKVAFNEIAELDGWERKKDNNCYQKWKIVSKFTEGELSIAEQEAKELQIINAQKMNEAERAVQKYINNRVKALGYDDENSISKYLVQDNAFYKECKAISLWIGNIWLKVHDIKDTVSSIEELIELLPILEEIEA